jgi:hypothetical protein
MGVRLEAFSGVYLLRNKLYLSSFNAMIGRHHD